MTDEPYLVTLSRAFDAERNCFYFHCSPVGRKIDLIRANPHVYGQVLEDRGYMAGQCDHAYRTVQFDGRAEFVSEPEEKLRAFNLLVDALEPEPGPVKEKMLGPERLGGSSLFCVGKVIDGGVFGG